MNDGNGGGNYTVSTATNTTGVITQASLTLTAATNTKTYDGTTSAAEAPTVAGLQGSDTVTGLTASYANKNAGSGKTLSVNAGYVVNDGNGGGNYAVSTVNNTTGVINQAVLTLAAVSDSRFYDATTNSAGAPIVAGLVGGDTVTGVSQSFANKNAGTDKTLLVNAGYVVNDGNGGGNYAVNTINETTGAIHQAALTLTAVTNSKTYDATTSAAATPTVTGLQGADTVTGLTASYADKNAGTGKTLAVNAGYVVNDGNGGGNYAVSTLDDTTGVITQRSITVSAPDNVTKVFDGNTSVPSSYVPVISGGVGEGVQSALLAYSTPDVGTGKTVDLSNVVMNDGNGGNNYIVLTVGSSSGMISPVVRLDPVIGPSPLSPLTTVQRDIPVGLLQASVDVAISAEDGEEEGFIQLSDIRPQLPEITAITTVGGPGGDPLPAGTSYDALTGRVRFESIASLPQHLMATGLDRNDNMRQIKVLLMLRNSRVAVLGKQGN